MKKVKRRFVVIVFLIALMLLGCTIKKCVVSYIKLDNKSKIEKIALQTIYKVDNGKYTIYSSELLDTYLIACALYFDFDSPNMLGDENTLYQHTKEYFLPYKNHPFIQNLGHYVDNQYKDSNFLVLEPIIKYIYSVCIENKAADTLKNTVFNSPDEFNIFLDNLVQFYKDTNAKKFFDANQEYQLKIRKCIDEEIENIPFEELIQTMESYVGNKEKYFKDECVKYTSLITLFRPMGASFYKVWIGNNTYFVSYQSALQNRMNVENFDIDQYIEHAIHEYLHMYINPAVETQSQLINQLMPGKEKITYGGELYQNMEWHRIVDENIVRAIETRIYADIYNDENKAYEKILKKEVVLGGFKKVDNIYDILKDYEINRDKYHTINEYIPHLIKALFK